MEIKTIEEAKKYMFKKIFCVDTEKTKPTKLFIGGVNLFYNNVNYDVVGFVVFQDKECKNIYGKIDIETIKNKFEKDNWLVYTFSYDLAVQYLVYQTQTEKEKEKYDDIERAKELLKNHKVKFEIFN